MEVVVPLGSESSSSDEDSASDLGDWESTTEYEIDSDSNYDESSASEPESEPSSLDRHYDFVEHPPQDVYCPVTLDILRNPCQTRCCGNHLSKYAARRLKRMRKRCPLCKKYPLKTVEDKYFQRVVLATKVRCSKNDAGCSWEGEMRELKKHLSEGCVEGRGKCRFVDILCPYNCGNSIQRHSLQEHQSNHCLKRPFTCSHCGSKGSYQSITNDHWHKCKKFPLNCPNQCSSSTIQRSLLKRHLSRDCLQQEMECEFGYAGCTARVKRCKLDEHLDENLKQHLRFLAKYTQQLHTHTSSSLSNLRCITFPNFKQHLRENREWYSPPFYSHIGGYKMCLGVDANGFSDSTGTHVGVAIYMLKGEFDAQLQWPFKGVVTIELVNQKEQGKNYVIDIVEESSHLERDYDDIFSKLTRGERSREGWGFTEFMSHRDLYKPRDGREFLRNDSLQLRVTKVVISSV